MAYIKLYIGVPLTYFKIFIHFLYIICCLCILLPFKHGHRCNLSSYMYNSETADLLGNNVCLQYTVDVFVDKWYSNLVLFEFRQAFEC